MNNLTNQNEVIILYAYLYDLGRKGFRIVADSDNLSHDLPELKGSSYWIEWEGMWRHNVGGEHAFHLKRLVVEMPGAFRHGMPLRFEIKNGEIISIS